MHKLLLTEPRIGSYSFFLLLAIFCGYVISRWRAPCAGVRPSHLDNLVLLIAVFSLFGARFFSWLFYFPPGVGLWTALRDGGGGMVFYGGFLFGLLTVVIYARLARLSLGNLLDVFAPGLALGLAIGRVGCFMAGCCWGDLCVEPSRLANLPPKVSTWQVRTIPIISGAGFPLAVKFPPNAGAYEQHVKLGLIPADAPHSLAVHPVQLYESTLALGLCLALHFWFEKRRWPGEVVCLAVLGYATIRFGTEFLRADNVPSYLGLTLSQVISLILGASSIAVLVVRHAASKRPEDLFPTRAISTPNTVRV
jgi:phosphatidylglycerol---prolipoprotein diacylglyceryl transferase